MIDTLRVATLPANYVCFDGSYVNIEGLEEKAFASGSMKHKKVTDC